MFYLYPDAPDIDGFIKSRTTKISFLWLSENVDKKDAYIQGIVDSDITRMGDSEMYQFTVQDEGGRYNLIINYSWEDWSYGI